jgi:hypothetical protein
MKKWTDKNIEALTKLNNDGLTNKEISIKLGRTEKSIKVKINRVGLKSNTLNKNEKVICSCCGVEFESLISDNRKYCSQSCAAKVNNIKYQKRHSISRINNTTSKEIPETQKCLYCNAELKNKNGKYCSSACQQLYYKKQIFEKIEDGDTTLDKSQYKKYLIYVHGNKCMDCGWDKTNVITGNVPIELEHVDGNSENNSLENLKLLCPNCHSLTPTYKALNVGNGRHSRRQRYKDGKSY